MGFQHNNHVASNYSPLSGGDTARPPRAAGRARRQHSEENFLYIKVEICSFLAIYFCIVRIVRVAPLMSSLPSTILKTV